MARDGIRTDSGWPANPAGLNSPRLPGQLGLAGDLTQGPCSQYLQSLSAAAQHHQIPGTLSFSQQQTALPGGLLYPHGSYLNPPLPLGSVSSAPNLHNPIAGSPSPIPPQNATDINNPDWRKKLRVLVENRTPLGSPHDISPHSGYDLQRTYSSPHLTGGMAAPLSASPHLPGSMPLSASPHLPSGMPLSASPHLPGSMPLSVSPHLPGSMPLSASPRLPSGMMAPLSGSPRLPIGMAPPTSGAPYRPLNLRMPISTTGPTTSTPNQFHSPPPSNPSIGYNPFSVTPQNEVVPEFPPSDHLPVASMSDYHRPGPGYLMPPPVAAGGAMPTFDAARSPLHESLDWQASLDPIDPQKPSRQYPQSSGSYDPHIGAAKGYLMQHAKQPFPGQHPNASGPFPGQEAYASRTNVTPKLPSKSKKEAYPNISSPSQNATQLGKGSYRSPSPAQSPLTKGTYPTFAPSPNAMAGIPQDGKTGQAAQEFTHNRMNLSSPEGIPNYPSQVPAPGSRSISRDNQITFPTQPPMLGGMPDSLNPFQVSTANRNHSSMPEKSVSYPEHAAAAGNKMPPASSQIPTTNVIAASLHESFPPSQMQMSNMAPNSMMSYPEKFPKAAINSGIGSSPFDHMPPQPNDMNQTEFAPDLPPLIHDDLEVNPDEMAPKKKKKKKKKVQDPVAAVVENYHKSREVERMTSMFGPPPMMPMTNDSFNSKFGIDNIMRPDMEKQPPMVGMDPMMRPLNPNIPPMNSMMQQPMNAKQQPIPGMQLMMRPPHPHQLSMGGMEARMRPSRQRQMSGDPSMHPGVDVYDFDAWESTDNNISDDLNKKVAKVFPMLPPLNENWAPQSNMMNNQPPDKVKSKKPAAKVKKIPPAGEAPKKKKAKKVKAEDVSPAFNSATGAPFQGMINEVTPVENYINKHLNNFYKPGANDQCKEGDNQSMNPGFDGTTISSTAAPFSYQQGDYQSSMATSVGPHDPQFTGVPTSGMLYGPQGQPGPPVSGIMDPAVGSGELPMQKSLLDMIDAILSDPPVDSHPSAVSAPSDNAIPVSGGPAIPASSSSQMSNIRQPSGHVRPGMQPDPRSGLPREQTGNNMQPFLGGMFPDAKQKSPARSPHPYAAPPVSATTGAPNGGYSGHPFDTKMYANATSSGPKCTNEYQRTPQPLPPHPQSMGPDMGPNGFAVESQGSSVNRNEMQAAMPRPSSVNLPLVTHSAVLPNIHRPSSVSASGGEPMPMGHPPMRSPFSAPGTPDPSVNGTTSSMRQWPVNSNNIRNKNPRQDSVHFPENCPKPGTINYPPGYCPGEVHGNNSQNGKLTRSLSESTILPDRNALNMDGKRSITADSSWNASTQDKNSLAGGNMSVVNFSGQNKQSINCASSTQSQVPFLDGTVSSLAPDSQEMISAIPKVSAATPKVSTATTNSFQTIASSSQANAHVNDHCRVMDIERKKDSTCDTYGAMDSTENVNSSGGSIIHPNGLFGTNTSFSVTSSRSHPCEMPSVDEPFVTIKTECQLPDGTNADVKPFTNVAEKLTPTAESIYEKLKSNVREEYPECNCMGPNTFPTEMREGPYYSHMGVGSSMAGVRKLMESRTGLTGKAIRIEKILYTGKEGKTSHGCPMAKWIVRRSGPDEKVMCIVRYRVGHTCPAAIIIVLIVVWEGMQKEIADDMYEYLAPTLTNHGFETDRRCGTNDTKTCACQGWDLKKRGASFSFGCSWSMYFNGCKFARSRDARKFKLKDTSKEADLEDRFQNIATDLAPLYKEMVPDAYENQISFENEALECRLGKKPGRPFVGVTSCVDFCAHSHKDFHNMNNGTTVVVTLTRHRGFSKPDDEQLHVLPLYVLDATDEFGDPQGQMDKIRSGALEVLNNYPAEARIRAYPLTPNKKKGRGAKKESPGSKKANAGNVPLPTTPGRKKNSEIKSEQSRDSSFMHSQDSSQSLPEQDSMQHITGSADSFSGKSLKPMLNENTRLFKEQKSEAQFLSDIKPDASKLNNARKPTVMKMEDQAPIRYEDVIAQASNPGFPQMYEEFWNFFYANGVFPPQTFLDSWNTNLPNSQRYLEPQRLFSEPKSPSKPAKVKKQPQNFTNTYKYDVGAQFSREKSNMSDRPKERPEKKRSLTTDFISPGCEVHAQNDSSASPKFVKRQVITNPTAPTDSPVGLHRASSALSIEQMVSNSHNQALDLTVQNVASNQSNTTNNNTDNDYMQNTSEKSHVRTALPGTEEKSVEVTNAAESRLLPSVDEVSKIVRGSAKEALPVIHSEMEKSPTVQTTVTGNGPSSRTDSGSTTDLSFLKNVIHRPPSSTELSIITSSNIDSVLATSGPNAKPDPSSDMLNDIDPGIQAESSIPKPSVTLHYHSEIENVSVSEPSTEKQNCDSYSQNMNEPAVANNPEVSSEGNNKLLSRELNCVANPSGSGESILLKPVEVVSLPNVTVATSTPFECSIPQNQDCSPPTTSNSRDVNTVKPAEPISHEPGTPVADGHNQSIGVAETTMPVIAKPNDVTSERVETSNSITDIALKSIFETIEHSSSSTAAVISKECEIKQRQSSPAVNNSLSRDESRYNQWPPGFSNFGKPPHHLSNYPFHQNSMHASIAPTERRSPMTESRNVTLGNPFELGANTIPFVSNTHSRSSMSINRCKQETDMTPNNACASINHSAMGNNNARLSTEMDISASSPANDRRLTSPMLSNSYGTASSHRPPSGMSMGESRPPSGYDRSNSRPASRIDRCESRLSNCSESRDAHTPIAWGEFKANSNMTAGKRYESPLELLSEAVSIRSERMEQECRLPQIQSFQNQSRYSGKSNPHSQSFSGQRTSPNHSNNKIASQQEAGNQLHTSGLMTNDRNPPPYMNNVQQNTSKSFDMTDPKNQAPFHLMKEMPFQMEPDSRVDCLDGCMKDPSMLSSEMEYNEENFHDPMIGGVAIGLSHGSVLFECAKRELHATTAVREPNRLRPTRISLVFYQHKSMNTRHHGWYENERKMEMVRQKRLEKMKIEKAEGDQETLSKPGPKKKRKKESEEETVDIMSTSAAQYRYLWDAPVRHALSMTTDSIITRWIDPQPMVTGPYQRWI